MKDINVKLKASEVIKTQCCGNLLQEPKCDLVKQVELLESENVLLENQLNNATIKIEQLKQKMKTLLDISSNINELNINNYTHDEVERLNEDMINLHEHIKYKVRVNES